MQRSEEVGDLIAALVSEVSIYKESICRIIRPAQPAEYDCELTLSETEDAALTA